MKKIFLLLTTAMIMTFSVNATETKSSVFLENSSYSYFEDSEDWDEVIEAYDRYVTKYISYMKRAAQGDISALSECTSLMEEAQELGEKLEKAKDEMSPAQIKKYNKITMRMLKAAQQM